MLGKLRPALVAFLLLSTLEAGASGGCGSPAATVGSTSRLFVVEKGGRIRILRYGALLLAAFLDLSGAVSNGGEQGLLGDVGQDALAEIDLSPPGSGAGANYGWNIIEGLSCYRPVNCNPSG